MAREPLGAPLRALAAILLLASLARAAPSIWGRPKPLNITLPAEGECPDVDAALLNRFVVGGASASGAPLLRPEAQAVSCQLGQLLQDATAGKEEAEAVLFAIYRAWRQAYRPHVWHYKLSGNGVNTRLPMWLSNLEEVVAINSDPAARFWAGLNAFSDMNAEEFATSVLLPPTAPASTQAVGTASGARKLLARLRDGAPTTTTITSIDWLAAGKVLPTAGFQSQCASSWAFATVAALEANLLIGTMAGAQSLQPVSPQNIMDCTARTFNWTSSPCMGGSMPQAFQLASQRGISNNNAYTYRPLNGGGDPEAPGFQKKCDSATYTPKQASGGLVRITGTPAYTQVAATKAALLKALAAQPAVAVITVDPSFRFYAGGVWSSSSCSGASPSYAVLITGFDTQVVGSEFVSVKASLGAGWGQGGFGKIALTDAGVCGMYQSVYQPATVQRIMGGKAPTKSSKAP